MTTMRDDFEAWASDEGQYPKAIQRNGEGYLLAVTQLYWQAWQACTERAAKLVEDCIPPLKPQGGRVEIGENARKAFATAIRGGGREG